MIIFFRKWYFFVKGCTIKFLKFTLKKILSLTDENYRVSIYFKKKFEFQRFWDQGQNWKKCENAKICNAKVKLNCNFWKHNIRDDYALYKGGFGIFVEIWSFWDHCKIRQNIIIQKGVWSWFSNTPNCVKKWSFKT